MAAKKPLVYITRRIPDVGIALLKKAGFTVKVNQSDTVLSASQLKKAVRGADAILSLLTQTIDGAVMDAAGPQLKIVANYAVGYDNIDLVAAQKRGVVVTNTPGMLTEAVAEHAVMLILALARRVIEADQFTRAKKYQQWEPMLLMGQDIRGKTIGIVGAGRIGAHTARIMHKGFDCQVLYTDVRKHPEIEKELGAQKVSLQTLLKKSDFVSLHVPLLPSTKHLIADKELALMKPNAILINTARGPVVKEKALLKALVKKQIAAAGLDVFECEPAIDCDTSDHYELRAMNNVILTPHIASATVSARDEMARVAAENIIAVLKGKKPLTAVK